MHDACFFVSNVAVTTATMFRSECCANLLTPRMQVERCVKCAAQLTAENKAAAARERACKKCVAKRTLLSQMFGGWPIAAFKELDADQQTLFWESAHDCAGKGPLQALVIKDITSHRVNIKLTRNGGTFWPLSVYATQGFKTENIEKNCASRWCEELEEHTYKLTQRSEIEDEVEKTVRAEVISLRDNSLKGRLSHYASPPQKKRSRSSSDSSSSSNSSESKGKAKAKAKAAAAAAKKDAIAKKAAAKAKAAAEKKAQAEAKHAETLRKKVEKKREAEKLRAEKEERVSPTDFLKAMLRTEGGLAGGNDRWLVVGGGCMSHSALAL